jgi:hypothetical protein
MLADHLFRSAYSKETIAIFAYMHITSGNSPVTNKEGRKAVNMLSLLTVHDKALQMPVLKISTSALGMRITRPHTKYRIDCYAKHV